MGKFEAKTSMDGTATIPAEVLDVLGLQPGGALQFIVDEDGKVTVVAKTVVAKTSDLAHLRGIFGKHEGPPLDIDEAIMETVARKTSLSRSGDDE